MCLLFCFVLFWILCCVVCEKNENKKLLITKKKKLRNKVSSVYFTWKLKRFVRIGMLLEFCPLVQ